jgi:catechol 2,3-dioxygenase-like lactoylglutathione lyase family enzyme
VTTDLVMPVDRLYRIGIVVKDLEKAALAYAQIFGIDSWQVRVFDEKRLDSLTVGGRTVTAKYRTATGTVPSGVATFELIDAGVGETTYQYMRCTREQGVHHLTVSVVDAEGLAGIKSLLLRHGVTIAQTERYTDGTAAHLFDTRTLLGGYYLQVVENGGPTGSTAEFDETWDLSSAYQRPDNRAPLDVTQLHHIGIVVNDVVASVAKYAEVFGITTWPFMNWRNGLGRLDDPFYRGKPVEQGYFCGMGFNYRNFGFEIIQPSWGPSHYKNDFLDVVGQGVHHLQLLYPSDAAEWDAIVDWLAPLDIPVVMGSSLREGATTFYYLDTRAALGGWTLEATIRHAGADPAKRIYDFTAEYGPAAGQ